MVAGSVLLVLVVYAWGLLRLWGRGRIGRGVRPRQAMLFGLGGLVLLIALSAPLDEWSERRLFAHMVQHELLMVVAAPLIALGAPAVALVWALPRAIRGRLIDWSRRSQARRVWSLFASPGSAFLLYGAALWVWHLPVLYELALEHEAVHALQHICFLGTATLFWWSLAHGRYGRLGYGAAAAYAFLTTLHSGLLGALLTIAPGIWYPWYGRNQSGGFSPLEDQQLAGLLMWVPGSIAFVAGGLTLFASWLRHSDRVSRAASGAALD